MAEKTQYDYRLCEVRDRKGDLDKRWYVEFWVWDVGTDSLVRKLDYIPAKFKTAPERYAECLRLKKAIDRELIGGAFVDSSGQYKKKPAAKPMAIIKAVEWFRAEHYNEVARPKELQLLKIRDIKPGKLLISATVKVDGRDKQLSKNHKSQYVVIPEGLREMIEESGILKYNPDYFIFGNKGEPGPRPYSKHYSSKKYNPVLKALEMDGGQTLYSWKHTGAIKLYQATKDMKKVQRQCRHWSITETDNYLRDLGLFEDDEVKFKFPRF